jgi:DNA-3-methyladenine glycosylase I
MGRFFTGPDGEPRCGWCDAAPEFLHYHDTEWGFPVDDDQKLFEKLCLEGFQSGLSWRTILAKRDNFRRAFHDFDFNKIACFQATSSKGERAIQIPLTPAITQMT